MAAVAVAVPVTSCHWQLPKLGCVQAEPSKPSNPTTLPAYTSLQPGTLLHTCTLSLLRLLLGLCLLGSLRLERERKQILPFGG